MIRKLKFDPLEVRPSFRSTFCRELMLPSGAGSGYFCYPISNAEVQKLTENFTSSDYEQSVARDVCKTESEYLLWIALRLKYGVTYLTSKPGYRPIHDSAYCAPAEPEIIDKIYSLVKNDVDSAAFEIFSDLDRKFIDLQNEVKDKLQEQNQEKNSKKFFDDDLTSPATML